MNSEKLFPLETLGRGGSGLVKKSYDIIDNIFIALKFFPKVSDEEDFLNLIKFEKNILELIENIRLANPSAENFFLKFFGLFRLPKVRIREFDHGSFGLKMESGICSLESIIKARGKYSCAEIRYILKELAQAFALLQENGIAHRDVKSANVILQEDPNHEGNFRYKLSDFGLAYEVPKDDLLSIQTIKGFTKIYAAPEVLKYHNELTSETMEIGERYNPYQADVYSLGLIVLEMMGISWTVDNVQEILLKPENFTEYKEVLPILEKILCFEASKRIDFKDLRALLEGSNDKLLLPKGEFQYFRKSLVQKEEKFSGKIKKLLHLYKEHQALCETYGEAVTRVDSASFHLKNAIRLLNKIKHSLAEFELKKLTYSNKEINKFLKVQEIFNCDQEEAFCQNGLGKISMNKGEFSKSEEILMKNLSFMAKLLTENSPDISNEEKYHKNIKIIYFCQKTYNLLGSLYLKKGNFAKAKSNYELSLKLNLLFLEGPNRLTVFCYSNLGSVCYEMADFSQAEILFNKALELSRKFNGENTLETASILGNLGVSYKRASKFKDSKECYERALEIVINLYGEMHTQSALLYSNLGEVEENKNKAEDYFNKSLSIRRKLLGEGDLFTASSYNKLGTIYFEKEMLDLAEENFNKCLKIREKILGKNHIDTAEIYNNLAQLYEKSDFDKALDLYFCSLKIYVKNFGELHHDSAMIFNNLGGIYHEMHEMDSFKDSFEFYKKALNIYIHLHGEENSDVGLCYNNLAFLFEDQILYLKSEKHYLKALKIFKKVYGENHNQIGIIYENLAMLYRAMGRKKESQECMSMYNQILSQKMQNI